MDPAGPGLAVFWGLENTDPPNFLFFPSSLPSLVAYAVEIGYHPSSAREKKQLQVAKKSGMTVIVLNAFPGKIPFCHRWPEDTGT